MASSLKLEFDYPLDVAAHAADRRSTPCCSPRPGSARSSRAGSSRSRPPDLRAAAEDADGARSLWFLDHLVLSPLLNTVSVQWEGCVTCQNYFKRATASRGDPDQCYMTCKLRAPLAGQFVACSSVQQQHAVSKAAVCGMNKKNLDGSSRATEAHACRGIINQLASFCMESLYKYSIGTSDDRSMILYTVTNF